MDALRGFMSGASIAAIEDAIVRGYKTAMDLQNPPLSVQLMRVSQESGVPEPLGEPFQPIRIRFGLREVATYGDQTPVQTARADADMMIWGTDPATGEPTPESAMRVNDFIQWTVAGQAYTARIAALYPTSNHAKSVEIELVQ